MGQRPYLGPSRSCTGAGSERRGRLQVPTSEWRGAEPDQSAVGLRVSSALPDRGRQLQPDPSGPPRGACRPLGGLRRGVLDSSSASVSANTDARFAANDPRIGVPIHPRQQQEGGHDEKITSGGSRSRRCPLYRHHGWSPPQYLEIHVDTANLNVANKPAILIDGIPRSLVIVQLGNKLTVQRR